METGTGQADDTAITPL